MAGAYGAALFAHSLYKKAENTAAPAGTTPAGTTPAGAASTATAAAE